jgi:hypothetical protein
MYVQKRNVAGGETMKALSVISIVLSVAVLAGMGYLTLQLNGIADRLEKMEADRGDDVKKLSNEVSKAFTNLGELGKQIRSVSDRVDSLAALKPGDNIEEIIERKLAERRDRQRKEREEQTRQWWARQRERQINEILEGIDADDETDKKVAEIVKNLQDAVTAYFEKAREEGNWDREATRKALDEMDAKSKAAAKKVLTEEQYKKFVEIRKKQDDRWRRGGR